ncbi:hypothetical protein ACOMHN_014497 [Nucella lapillus]
MSERADLPTETELLNIFSSAANFGDQSQDRNLQFLPTHTGFNPTYRIWGLASTSEESVLWPEEEVGSSSQNMLSSLNSDTYSAEGGVSAGGNTDRDPAETISADSWPERSHRPPWLHNILPIDITKRKGE